MKALLATLLMISLTAVAHGEDTIDQRQENQEKRIEAGQEKGELTDREAKRLERRQKRIEKMEERAKADGTVSADEAKHIKKAQNQASREIRRKNHNKRQK